VDGLTVLPEKIKGNAARRRIPRRQFLEHAGKAAGLTAMGNIAMLAAGCGGGISTMPPPSIGDGYAGTDDQLLEEIEKSGFLFFWEQADPATGQVKDRALAVGNYTAWFRVSPPQDSD